jgi:hypothetical protein
MFEIRSNRYDRSVLKFQSNLINFTFYNDFGLGTIFLDLNRLKPCVISTSYHTEVPELPADSLFLFQN